MSFPDVPIVPGVSSLSPIGRGRFASVFAGYQERFGRRVAVKVLDGPALDADSRRRFEREAAVIGRMSTHPYVVTVYESTVLPSGQPALITELCPGGSLAQRLSTTGPLSVAETVEVGRTIGRALQEAHRQGIVHRDVTPANILLRALGEPALADFGLSLRTSRGPDALGLQYAAPETVASGVHTPASDAYSFGATLYALLAGRPPFPRDAADGPLAHTDLVRSGQLPPLGRGDVPAPLAELVRAMLAADPAARPRDEVVLEQFEALAAGRTPAPLPITPPAPAPTTGPPPGWTPGWTTAPTAAPATGPAPGWTTGSTAAAATGPVTGPPTGPTPEWTGPTPEWTGPGSGSRAAGQAPVGPAPSGRGRRVGLVIAAVVAVVLLAGGGAFAATVMSRSDPPAAASSPTPAPTAETTPPPGPTLTASPTPSPTLSPTGSPTPVPVPTFDVPAGYRRVTGSGGLSVAIPTSWVLHRGAPIPTNSEVNDPAGAKRLLRFGADPKEGSSIRAKVAALETRARNRDGYELLRLEDVRGTGGAVDWEFVFTDDDGVPTHAYGRYWRVGPTDYVVYASAPEADWTATADRHLVVMMQTARTG